MPYRTIWVPPDNVEKIKVILGTKDALPDEFERWPGNRAIRKGLKEDPLRNIRRPEDFLHFCPICKGWVEGEPDERREDTIGPLCGRRGIVASCRRCGWEIDFNGMVS